MQRQVRALQTRRGHSGVRPLLPPQAGLHAPAVTSASQRLALLQRPDDNRRMSEKPLYKVTFLHLGKSYQVHARHVASSHLWGFTEVGELTFAEAGSLVVDPTEERLREEFADTDVLHLPMQAIVRIEQVRRKGALAIRDASGGEKVTPFPMPPTRPRGG